MAKKKAVAIAVPRSREEAERLAEELGQLVRADERQKSEAADKIAAIRTELKTAQADATAKVKTMMAALCAWAAVARGELLTGKLKSFQLGAGTAGWRTTPPKLDLDDEELTILTLEAMAEAEPEGPAARVLRVVTELDKDALKADPELIGQLAGVRVISSERFYFRPLDVASDVETAVKGAAA